MNFLKPQPKQTSKAAERFRQYDRSANGKITVYLPPKRGDELNEKLKELVVKRDAAINGAGDARTAALKSAKAVYDKAVQEAEDANRKAVAVANDAYDDAEAKLLAEYARPLSAEEVALLTTRPGDVVRIPEAKVA